MTARLSESASAGHRAARVVSVSPLTARSAEPCERHSNRITHETSPACDDDVFTLTRRAGEIIARLNAAMDQAAMSDAQTRDAVGSLQDRLRVSARMLQAFQAQIVRIEDGISELEKQRHLAERAVQNDTARLDDQAAAFEQRIEAAICRFEQRLAELSRAR